MRKPPVSPPEVAKKSDDQLTVLKRTYKLITPLFGGGVEPGEADPVTIIRGASVRGQLRFWWRACRSPQFATLTDLKHREDSIWGSTETPSQVTVQVAVDKSQIGRAEAAFETGTGRNPNPSSEIAPYAAFPLQPDKNQRGGGGWESKSVRIGVSFDLTLRFPNDLKSDVAAALWAWETFGGIGGRTRRGFGALQLVKDNEQTITPPYPEEVKQRIIDGLREHVAEGTSLQDIPCLVRDIDFTRDARLIVTKDPFNPVEMWKQLIEKLKLFRQARYKKDFGLSKWPEANEIRRQAGRQPKFPQDSPKPELVRKFPRGVFGLPIIFHFPQDKLPDATLTGAEHDRLASPLILRPLACAQGKAVGLALILNTPQTLPDGVVLRRDGFPADPVSVNLTKDEAARVPPLQGQTDVLQAFLNTLK
ncbi:MAG: type III-B CRISPR module RAMP protein Cmr1 [Blastocatellales bacterium]|nr:type III-B CRISPR module RAMP protein Cmr1 [Blastocatellales bacterium]